MKINQMLSSAAAEPFLFVAQQKWSLPSLGSRGPAPTTSAALLAPLHLRDPADAMRAAAAAATLTILEDGAALSHVPQFRAMPPWAMIAEHAARSRTFRVLLGVFSSQAWLPLLNAGGPAAPSCSAMGVGSLARAAMETLPEVRKLRGWTHREVQRMGEMRSPTQLSGATPRPKF